MGFLNPGSQVRALYGVPFFKGIDNMVHVPANIGYLIIDCPSCEGDYHFVILSDEEENDENNFDENDVCKTCKGVGLVKIPVKDIQELHLGIDYLRKEISPMQM